MINKKLVKKIVDHTLHPEKKHFIDNHIMHPDREWSIGLLIGLVICVSGVVWSLYAFDFYKSIEVGKEEVETGVVVYRASMVDEVLRDFAEREKIYNSLLSKSQPAVFLSEDGDVQAVVGSSTIEVDQSLEINGTESENSSNSDLATSSTSIEGEEEVILDN